MCKNCKHIILSKSFYFRNRAVDVDKSNDSVLEEWVMMTGSTLDCMCGCGRKSEYLLANEFNNTLLGITRFCTGKNDECNCELGHSDEGYCRAVDDLIELLLVQSSQVVRFGVGSPKQYDWVWYETQISDKPYKIRVVQRSIVNRIISQNVSAFECECGCNSFLTILLCDVLNGETFIIGRICARDAHIEIGEYCSIIYKCELSQISTLVDSIKNMTEEQIRYSLENRMSDYPHINMFELAHLTKQTGGHLYDIKAINWTILSLFYRETVMRIIDISRAMRCI